MSRFYCIHCHHTDQLCNSAVEHKADMWNGTNRRQRWKSEPSVLYPRITTTYTFLYLLIQKPILLYMRNMTNQIVKCSKGNFLMWHQQLFLLLDLVKTQLLIITANIRYISTDHRSSGASFHVGQVWCGSNGSHQAPGTRRPRGPQQSWRAL